MDRRGRGDQPLVRILETSPKVEEFKIGQFLKDLFGSKPGAVKLQYVRYTHAHVPNTRPSPALRWVGSDSCRQIFHGSFNLSGFVMYDELTAR